MDLGEKDNFDLEKRNAVPLNYHSSNMWQLSNANHSNLSMGMVPRERDRVGSSVSVADPYHPNLWNEDGNVGGIASNMAPEKGVTRNGSQTLSEYPAELAFIEQASRFSNAGNFNDIGIPFNISETADLYSRAEIAAQAQGPFEVFSVTGANSHHVRGSVERGTDKGSLTMERGKGYVSPCNEASKECNVSYEAEVSDSGHQVETSLLQAGGLHSTMEGQSVKKRKKPSQVMEIERTGGASQLQGDTTKDDSGPKQKNGQNPNTISKDHPKISDAPKEDYIHVRARRGQATNSHSLAERVRREKISERMKYLQDLVPGCDKVTGKAVMLDEIINYVQSLQRQVEFLSMKLATVFPCPDLNIEGLLTKDIHQSQGSPSMFPFQSDANMVHTQLHPSQGFQASIPGIGNPLDALRRSVNSQLMAMNGEGYKDSNQVPNLWDDGLSNNVFPMNFGSNGPYNGQGLSGSLPSDHMKVEF